MKSKRQTQAERRAATREALLEAAARVFVRSGFHAASLDEIAEDAGVTRGAVYYNFAGKEELFLVLLERRCEERIRDIEAVLATSDGSLDDLVAHARIAADHASDAMLTGREWRTLFLEFRAHAARNERFRRELSERTRPMLETLARVIDRQAATIGVQLPMPADQLAIVIDALATGLSTAELVGEADVSRDLLGEALALLLHGIAARAGAAGRLASSSD